MILKELSFKNFRNLKDGSITVSQAVNIVYGKNGQGKTNLLEGIWLLGGLRSFRCAKDRELIKEGCSNAEIEACFFSQDREQTAKLSILANKREAVINGVKKKSASSLIGVCSSVVFSPEHLTMIKNGPGERRRFIDSAICRFKPKYANIYARYNKILTQRNALLKAITQNGGENMLEPWDVSLASWGAALVFERLSYIRLLREYSREIYCGISGGLEKLTMNYQSSFGALENDSMSEIEQKLLSRLKDNRKEDINYRVTSSGPHRDDIEIMINGKSARIYGSQGQQRSAVIAMKLSEADILQQEKDEKPVIILDDVLSELDVERQKFLLNKTRDRQVFISCCDKSAVEYLDCGRIFYVNSGQIEAEEK
ncbi:MULTISPECIES: DNA replication/repair protein RecF [unclassified Ruminococcus]|uniref:DNA replication/repair protein RecF n=1 Tax=unclassified Ruminococcus TaxID=2608920 RepID=UPI00210C0318|nr:DNA replication/repair protein RecF [Ruminococcus sp. zg-924]MCQ4114500.1 DNA replication/repair protein RecF [Ruminococcus sp. zg-921]